MRTLKQRTPAEREQPFYLQLMILDAHAPRVVTPAQRDRFDDGVGPEVADYRATLHRADRAIGHLVEALGDMGYDDDNTVFVVIGDHGEGLHRPRRAGSGHGDALWPGVVEVPWIVWGAGVEPGHRIDGLASQVDVLPSLLGLVGIEGPEGPGLDLSPQLRGQSAQTDRAVAYADTWFGVRRSAVFTEDGWCQRDWGREDIARRGAFPDGCFARSDETRRLQRVGAPALRRALVDWRRQRLADGTRSQAPTVEIDEELRAQLEALGYLEG